MARAAKCRRVCAEPENRVFRSKLSGKTVLSVEELETLRLADLEGLDQDTGAKRMEISRGTFQRILYAARRKIAGALVEGKTIVIDGGNYQIAPCPCCAMGDKPCRNCRWASQSGETIHKGDQNT